MWHGCWFISWRYRYGISFCQCTPFGILMIFHGEKLGEFIKSLLHTWLTFRTPFLPVELKAKSDLRGMTTPPPCLTVQPFLFADGKIGRNHDFANFAERRRGGKRWRGSLEPVSMEILGSAGIFGGWEWGKGPGRGASMTVIMGVCIVVRKICGAEKSAGSVLRFCRLFFRHC